MGIRGSKGSQRNKRIENRNASVNKRYVGRIRPSDNDTKIYDNTEQTIIQISEDRLELNARDYTENIKSIPEICGWGGIIVSILLTYFTAEFQNTWLLNGEHIKQIFIAIGIGLIYKLLTQVWNFINYKYRCKERAFDPKTFVKKCRKNEKIGI